MNFVDCKKTPDPQNPEDPCASFDCLKYAFTELLLEVVNVSYGATPPTYEEIMRLDRRLHDYYIPFVIEFPAKRRPLIEINANRVIWFLPSIRPLFQVAGINEDGKPRPPIPPNPPVALALQSHALTMLRENALLYMHRSFFAKALNEFPDNPSQVRCTISVRANATVTHPPVFTRAGMRLRSLHAIVQRAQSLLLCGSCMP